MLGTVISFHEDPIGLDPGHLVVVRGHFLRVLRQLSEVGRKQVEGMEVLALRYPPDSKPAVNPSASESASNLLYYLFDNWASTIVILKNLRSELALVVSSSHLAKKNCADEMIRAIGSWLDWTRQRKKSLQARLFQT